MADSREVTYGVVVETGGAVNSIEKLKESLDSVDEAEQKVQIGAQNVSQALCDMGVSGAQAAEDAGNSAIQMGAAFRDSGDDAADSFRAMATEADAFGASVNDANSEVTASFDAMSEGAEGFGAAVSDIGYEVTEAIRNVDFETGALSETFNVTSASVAGSLGAIIAEAENLGSSVQDVGNGASRALSGVGVAADEAGEKVHIAGSNATEAIRAVSSEAANTGAAIRDAGAKAAAGLDDAEESAEDLGKSVSRVGDEAATRFKKMGADAESFGAAFKKVSTAALKDGQSLSKALQTGLSGAFSYVGKKFTVFKNDVAKGAKAIGTAFIHPIQTIRNNLVGAFGEAAEAEEDVDNKAIQAERDLKAMGDAGERGGNQIKDAISGALKAFVGIEAIKAGVSALKDFVSSALSAATAAENTAAKFDRMFEGTGAAEWADNFSDAVNRSTTEVKDFLVQNQAMYDELGVTGDAATDLSKITTSLAYDFGNAFNMDDAEALSVIQDAITGNTSALNEYGFNLDDATIKAQALKLGLSDNIDKMDDATLSQLRLNAILEQSEDVQKAAIEQSDGLTNSMKSLNGIWSNFMEDAGAKFTPVIEEFFGTIMDAWPQIEPMLMQLVEILSEGLSQAMPIITELGTTLFPILVDILGTVFDVATPVLEVFGELAAAILPPLTEILSVLVDTLLPPILSIFEAFAPIIEGIMPIIQKIAEALLPPIAELLGLVAPLLEAMSPVLDVIGNVLGTIAEVLGDVIGWVADGAGKVVGFFSNLFGGATESEAAVQDLNGAVSELDAVTSKETSLAVDTSSYTKDVTKASAEANTAAQESIIETKNISDLNLQLMGMEASSTYSTMAIDAEEAWSRMTAAAETGAQEIVKAFNSIASAALNVSNANISVTGASIPSNASGDDNFAGGWTEINEHGGEVAFLPSGSAIIPADKSKQLIEGSTSGTATASSGMSFTPPNIVINIQGNPDNDTISEMTARLKQTFKELYEEARSDELTSMTLKNAYA